MDDLTKRLRSLVILYEVSSDKDLGRKAAECIEAQAAEIADLRAQLSRMIDPAKMLRWEHKTLCLGPFPIGWVTELAPKSDWGWGLTQVMTTSNPADTESEARAVVERAVLSSLGVK